MDLRVNQLQQPAQIEPKASVPESDGSFRFTLLSSIQEQELQASLAVMMEDITQQGNKLSRRMDIRDMKLYRKMIKEFMNEIVTHLMEAAYQREVYKLIDAGDSVQAETLSNIMKETLQKFWGDDVEISDDAALTWMRQPHYYMGLYSYTYSAGLTVATQVCRRIETEGQTAVDDWKKVLTAGSTKTPEELAKMAGVDISTDAPLLDTIETIGSIIDEICELTEELGC